MKAPTCKVDGAITFTSVKRKTFSKTELRPYKKLAILAEETVIAWEEKDLKAFVALGYALSGIDGVWSGTKEDLMIVLEDKGVAAWGKWVLATRDKTP